MILKENIPIDIVEIEPGNYHLFVFAKAGRNKIRFLLDTGASKTAFDKHKILKISGSGKQEQTEIHSIGLGSSQVHTQIRALSSLAFQEIKMKEVEVAVLDLNHVNEAYKMLGIPQIDGVLGSDILYKLKAVIHLEKRVLQIKLKK